MFLCVRVGGRRLKASGGERRRAAAKKIKQGNKKTTTNKQKTHDRERADALAVQPEVFRVALRDRDGVAVGDKAAQRGGVAVAVSGREPLVRHVERRPVALLLHQQRDLRPLLGRRVDAGRVVRARWFFLLSLLL